MRSAPMLMVVLPSPNRGARKTTVYSSRIESCRYLEARWHSKYHTWLLFFDVRLWPEESLGSQESSAETSSPETRWALLILTGLENPHGQDRRAPGWELLGLLGCRRELSPDIGAMSKEKMRQTPVL